MVDCKLDLNAIMADNSAGGSPAPLFVYLFYHQPFVTSVTKTSKAGLLLFLSLRHHVGISKSETDPVMRQETQKRNDLQTEVRLQVVKYPWRIARKFGLGGRFI